jgi:hypothetical protein
MLASAKIIGNSMGVVIWGAIGTLGTSFDQRWSAAERALWTMNYIHPNLLSVIVGLILSDGSLFIPPKGVNASLYFQQSMSHFPYFMHVWSMLAPLCQSIFSFRTHKIKGTLCYSIRFHTRRLPFLTEWPRKRRTHIRNPLDFWCVCVAQTGFITYSTSLRLHHHTS